jgi:hypothetical protein
LIEATIASFVADVDFCTGSRGTTARASSASSRASRAAPAPVAEPEEVSNDELESGDEDGEEEQHVADIEMGHNSDEEGADEDAATEHPGQMQSTEALDFENEDRVPIIITNIVCVDCKQDPKDRRSTSRSRVASSLDDFRGVVVSCRDVLASAFQVQ